MSLSAEIKEAIQSVVSIHLAFTLGQAFAAGMSREEIIEMVDATEREMKNPTEPTVNLLESFRSTQTG